MTTIGDVSVFDQLGLSQTQTTNTSNTLGQEDFLKLMTTQLKNQDPSKPMDSGEFLSQMAQFGTVQGIKDLELAFWVLSDSLYSNQALQASSLVGRQVLVPGGEAVLPESGSISGAVDLPETVSQLNVGVYDQAGQLVQTLRLGPQAAGLVSFDWDGLGADGERLPPGTYELRAEGMAGGTTQALDVLIRGVVESVTLPQFGGPMRLQVNGLGSVDFSAVRQIS